MPTQKLAIVGSTTFLVALISFMTLVEAAQVNLIWTAPTSNVDGTPLTDLAGYKVFYGQLSRSYGSTVDVGNTTAYTLSGLAGGQRYYFSVIAYDTSRNESSFSDEVSLTTPTDPPPLPVASFTATPTSGPVPLAVAFADSSTGNITSWSWTFGDNGTSTDRHPNHIYNSAGSYAVSLTVSGPNGSDVETKTGYIVVGAAATGLVAAYDFNEASGNTVTDSSGRGNHGTISGATRTTSGRFGKGLTFDGVNDWVTVADASSLDLTTGMTLEAWVYPTTHGNKVWRNVLIKERSAGEVYNLYSNTDTNAPTAYVVLTATPNDPKDVRSTGQLPLNSWTHLATTYDGSVLRLFVNGNLVNSRSLPGALLTSSGPLRIGGNSIWGEFFKGRIDEVRVYNRALSNSQIQIDANTPVGTASSSLQVLDGVRIAPVPHTSRGNLRSGSAPGAFQASRDAKSTTQPRLEGHARDTGAVGDDVKPLDADLLELGEVQVDHRWKRVQLRKVFADPVVIANMSTAHAVERVIVSVRNMEPTGFEARIRRWHDQADAYPPTTIDYLVMERGIYTLGDQTLVEAGSFEIDDSTPSGFQLFSRQFKVVPVVVTAVTSANDSDLATSEIRAVTSSGVSIQLQQPTASPLGQAPETISYIAWEPSSGTVDGLTFQVNRTPEIAPGESHAIAFPEPFPAPPVSIAAIQTSSHGHPGSIRWLSKGLDSAEMTIDDSGLNGETTRNTGIVGYLMLK